MDGKRRFSTGNKTVDAVGRMHFHGNIVPSAWYETIVKDTAGCDSIALLILADIVYWYRPTEVRDEQTGEVVGMRKKFRADILQRNYKQLEKSLGVTRSQAKAALQRLEDLGLVKRVFRTVDTGGMTLANVMFIDLDAERLREVTFPDEEGAEESDRGYGVITPYPHRIGDPGYGAIPSHVYRDLDTEEYKEITDNLPTQPSQDFEAAWQAMPEHKRSARSRRAALREWELRKEEYGLDDEFLRRSYCRYVSTQESNVEPKYIATLSTWLQPDNPKIRGYSFDDALENLKAIEEKRRAEAERRRREEQEERDRIEREEAAEAYREKDPEAKKLYEAAFKPEKQTTLQERIESMNEYFSYMGDHFGHV